jgi:hypothetical protein
MILEYLLVLLTVLALLFLPLAGDASPAAALAQAVYERWAAIAWLLSLY